MAEGPREKPKNNDGCEWCGRFGLSGEEIEALLVAAALVRGLDTREGSPETWLLDSARAKLRAYLGNDDV